MSNPNIVAVFDIETLDTKPTGIILSLGVVFFNLAKVQSFQELVDQGTNIYFDQDEQTFVKRTVSQDTLNWWADQGEEAAGCLDNPNKVSCLDLYSHLGNLYKKIDYQPDRKNTRWFSRGFFDIAFMDNFCESFDLQPMVKYWAWRDSRSYLDGLGIGTQNEKLKEPEGFIQHNSHHDAAFEAYMIQRIINNEPLELAEKPKHLLKYTYSKGVPSGTADSSASARQGDNTPTIISRRR